MKKMYVTPQMQAVKINQSINLLNASRVGSVDGNTGFTLGGAGNGHARSRECDWDDEW